MYAFLLLPPIDPLAAFTCALHRRQHVTTFGPVYQYVVIRRRFLEEAGRCQGHSLLRNVFQCCLAHVIYEIWQAW
jgi:hypothetical protein